MSFRHIGARIQLAREEKGISQEQLARALGCSQSALSNYEKGKRRLYLSQLETLTEVLDKPMEYFVDNGPDTATSGPAGNNEKLLQIMNSIEQFSDDELIELDNYVAYLNWKNKRRL